jgi:DNA (cytosine-5)-methyltransferase 1
VTAWSWYNEHDPFAAQWLRNLIAEGVIADGIVDERDIREVEAYELAEFAQCHFFAGIGVWSYALRQSGWPDDKPIWSGSCPCPPFSQAGKGQSCPACGGRRNLCHPRKTGHFICLSCGCDHYADDRHLWPEFARLIRDGKPSKIVGEQVASADGRIWLAAVSADLQTMGYAVAGADICAAGFGGAHIRQRNYFVGLSGASFVDTERRSELGTAAGEIPREKWEQRFWNDAKHGRQLGRLENAELPEGSRQREYGSENLCVQDPSRFARASDASGLADDNGGGRNRITNIERIDDNRQETEWWENYGGAQHGSTFHRNETADAPMCGRHAADWLFCRDGKWRPVEPFTFPLVDAAPSRVGRLRAYGNALDAETAIQFCGAVREICAGI